MNVAIVGSRNFNDFIALENYILKNFDVNCISAIISGGARGADILGEKFAKKYGIDTIIFKPDWERYGKSAGFIRNKLIVKYSDVVVAFWDSKSRGTQDTINQALKLKKRLLIFKF